VVADGLPIAVGAAQGEKLLGRDTVVCCFFGDGAANRGPFMEALNWAAVYTLPVLFVCENNSYASTTRTETVTAGPGLRARAESFGVPAFAVDGNDVEAVDELAGRLVREIRSGAGPKLIEARTYRLHGHTAADAGAYRDAKEVEERWKGDPIARCAAALRRLGVPEGEIKAMDESAEQEMSEAVTVALAAPWPDPNTAFTDVQDVGGPA
jgi:pyruvate dehydrogenase E1 component alpha subunit